MAEATSDCSAVSPMLLSEAPLAEPAIHETSVFAAVAAAVLIDVSAALAVDRLVERTPLLAVSAESCATCPLSDSS